MKQQVVIAPDEVAVVVDLERRYNANRQEGRYTGTLTTLRRATIFNPVSSFSPGVMRWKTRLDPKGNPQLMLDPQVFHRIHGLRVLTDDTWEIKSLTAAFDLADKLNADPDYQPTHDDLHPHAPDSVEFLLGLSNQFWIDRVKGGMAVPIETLLRRVPVMQANEVTGMTPEQEHTFVKVAQLGWACDLEHPLEWLANCLLHSNMFDDQEINQIEDAFLAYFRGAMNAPDDPIRDMTFADLGIMLKRHYKNSPFFQEVSRENAG